MITHDIDDQFPSIVRAVLFVSATTTTLAGRRFASRTAGVVEERAAGTNGRVPSKSCLCRGRQLRGGARAGNMQDFDGVRGDPRLQDLLRRMSFPAAGATS
jgi:hypothetical protein